MATPEEAVAKAVHAGVDLICDDPTRYPAALPATTVAAVKRHLLPEREFDQAITRLVEVRMRLGQFDSVGSGCHAGISASDLDTPAHHALEFEAARRIAVIGPNADSLDPLIGNYHGTPSAPSPSSPASANASRKRR